MVISALLLLGREIEKERGVRELKLTLKQAVELEFCPHCKNRLRLGQDKKTLIKSWSNLELDCITHFECPFCNTQFSRDKKELIRKSSRGF